MGGITGRLGGICPVGVGSASNVRLQHNLRELRSVPKKHELRAVAVATIHVGPWEATLNLEEGALVRSSFKRHGVPHGHAFHMIDTNTVAASQQQAIRQPSAEGTQCLVRRTKYFLLYISYCKVVALVLKPFSPHSTRSL